MTTKSWVKRPDAPARLSGRKGQQRRARWLSSQPLCIMCEREGFITAGTDVDHVVPLSKGGADDESNLQTLCHAHHQDKSVSDKGQRIRPTIGLDGWQV